MQNSDANGDPALLGPDLLARIFSLLPPQSLLAAACVSQNWQKIVGERGERLWQEHAEVGGGRRAVGVASTGATAATDLPSSSTLVCTRRRGRRRFMWRLRRSLG